MLSYLIWISPFIWYYRNILINQRYLINLNWFIGYIYANIKTSKLYHFLTHQYISFFRKNDRIQIYSISNNILSKIDYRDLGKSDYSKFYVKINLNNNHEKIFIFDNKNTLIEKYDELKELLSFEGFFRGFSDVLEVNTSNGEEVLVLLNKYISKYKNFRNITNYRMKVSDLYDFDNKKFLLDKNDKLIILTMKLKTIELNPDDYLDI